MLPADGYLDRIVNQQAALGVDPSASQLVSNIFVLLRRYPCLGILSRVIGVSYEAIFECLMLFGIALSILTLLGHRSFVTFSAMWIAYLSLFLAGQTFLSFQWDILLLEIGFLTAVAHTYIMKRGAGPRIVQLLFRFIFWKLMFMSGIVKLQANCPTWLHLTALEVSILKLIIHNFFNTIPYIPRFFFISFYHVYSSIIS